MIYTASGSIYANTVIEHIDRYNLIHEKLYRRDLVKNNDRLVKDLTKFSKDMDRVLLVDSRPDSCLQQDNQIRISPYFGDSNDNELKRLSTFFKDKVSEMQHNVDLRTITQDFTLN